MAFDHFVRKTREVRLGGWRIFGRQVGGGTYTVGPLSVLRWAQFCQATKELVETPADVAAIAKRAPAAVLRAIVPVLIEQPVDDRHIKRASPFQLALVFAAFGETNDLDYLNKGLTGDESDKTEGEPKRTGLEFVAVGLAQRLHIGDPHTVLHWPMQTLLAVCEVLAEMDKELSAAAAGGDGTTAEPPPVDDLALQLKKIGIVVN